MASTNKPDDGLGKSFQSDKEKFSYWIGMISDQQPKGQIKRFDIDLTLRPP